MIASWTGDILFSHEGVTGPAALEVSRPAALALERGPVEIVFDFFPGKEFTSVDQDLIQILRMHSGRTVETLLDSWMPSRLVPSLLQSIGVDPKTRGYVLQREERRAIVGLLKTWRIGRAGTIALARGEVTAGGVSLGEVDPKTMESRIVRGLFLCGEVLDIAGPVGGYNLQAAFSTGYVAGKTAARRQARNSQAGIAVLPV
jgi:predicted Rossmann fold flavoprotein